jgi:hypothetical protein
MSIPNQAERHSPDESGRSLKQTHSHEKITTHLLPGPDSYRDMPNGKHHDSTGC